MRPFARRRARDFGELNVVADGDGDLTEIRFENTQSRARRDLPFLGLEPRHVQLALDAKPPGATEEKGLVVNDLSEPSP